MQAVCDVLEQLAADGTLNRYAIGGATAAGFHGEPLATRDIDVFVYLDPPPGSLLPKISSHPPSGVFKTPLLAQNPSSYLRS